MMAEQTAHVRTALMPLCYKDFRCLADGCRDNCCGGWEISFRKKDYLQIKRSVKSPELKELLGQGLSRLRSQEHDGMYAYFKLSETGRCQFQSEEGLCRLQLECGEKVLPHVCQIFPRKHVYTPAARESSLSPACEGVLALLWDLPQGIDFWEEPLPKQEWRQVEMSPRWERFADIRSLCIDVLQERSLRLDRRMLLLGMLVQKLRDTEWTEEGVVDRWLAQGESQLHDPSASAVLDRLAGNRLERLTADLRVLMELYVSEQMHRSVFRELFDAISAAEDWETQGFSKFSIDTIRYQRLEGQLDELLGRSDWFFENLMVMTAFYRSFPDLLKPDGMWRGYVTLCILYSFYRFAAVCGCCKEVSRERLFQVISTVSRGLLHNEGRLTKLVDAQLQSSGGTLAHMAVLLGG